MSVGKKISQLRKERRMSQEELSEALGVSRQAVSKWENEICYPDTENLIRLSQIFGVGLVRLTDKTETISDSHAPGKQTEQWCKAAVPILSVLLLIAVGAAVCFAILWRQEAQLRLEAESAIQETIALQNRWESVRMYTGTTRDEIELTEKEQAELAERIWDYYYTEKESQKEDEPICGGLLIEIEFTKNEMKFSWSFTTRDICCTVWVDDRCQAEYQYVADMNLINWLKTYL